MTLKTELMSASLPVAAASRLGFDAPATGLTALGTNQATAFPLVSNFSSFGTVASGTGALIPIRGDGMVFNNGSNALLLYPPVGGNINGLAANASISVPAGKSAIIQSAGTSYGVNVSA